MLYISFWLLGILLIVAQTTILPYLPESIGRPDFLYILVAFCGYRFAWIPGIVLVFSLGWVMDVVAGVYLGIYPLFCLLTFCVLKLLTVRSVIKESTFQIPLVGISYFLVQILFYFVYSMLLSDVLPEWSWGEALRRTGILVVTAIPLFTIFGVLHAYFVRRRMRAKPMRRRSAKPIQG